MGFNLEDKTFLNKLLKLDTTTFYNQNQFCDITVLLNHYFFYDML